MECCKLIVDSGGVIGLLLPEYIVPHAVHLLAHRLPTHDSLSQLIEAKL